MNDEYLPYRNGEQSPRVKEIIEEINQQIDRLEKRESAMYYLFQKTDNLENEQQIA